VLALGLALAAAAAQAQLKPRRAPARLRPGRARARRAAARGRAAEREHAELEKAGQTAAQAWLLLLDRKDWGTAWDASSQCSARRAAAGLDGQHPQAARARSARFVEREPVEAAYKKTLPGRPDGDYVTVMFASRFANKEQVQEIVTTVREPTAAGA
jgi:hypothetical protein